MTRIELFKPEDFILEQAHIQNHADRANRKLNEWLESQQTVYMSEYVSEHGWSDDRSDLETHKAKLVCIEEIPKECVHRPSISSFGKDDFMRVSKTCAACGKELKAPEKWETK